MISTRTQTVNEDLGHAGDAGDALQCGLHIVRARMVTRELNCDAAGKVIGRDEKG